MRDYFMSLVVASVIGTVLSMIASSTFEKYVKYIVSLICILIILTPLKGLLGLTTNFETYTYNESILETSGSEGLILELSKERVIEAVNDAILKRFNVTPVSIEVVFVNTEEGISAERIDITLKTEDSNKADEIKNYLSALLGVEINVAAGGEEVG